jgi:hypothetical protein
VRSGDLAIDATNPARRPPPCRRPARRDLRRRDHAADPRRRRRPRVALALITHLATLWFAVVMGLACLAFARRRVRERPSANEPHDRADRPAESHRFAPPRTTAASTGGPRAGICASQSSSTWGRVADGVEAYRKPLDEDPRGDAGP